MPLAIRWEKNEIFNYYIHTVKTDLKTKTKAL